MVSTKCSTHTRFQKVKEKSETVGYIVIWLALASIPTLAMLITHGVI